MSRFRDVLTLAAVLGWGAALPAGEPNERSARETRGRVKYLIEMLASKNSAPPIRGDMGGDQFIEFPKGYDKSLQVPVYLAAQQLAAEGEAALEPLIAHTGDKRYSFSVTSSSDFNRTVSDACEMLARTILTGFQDDLHYITRSQFDLYPKLDESETLAEWWKKNKGRGLPALQIEALDAGIAFMKDVDGKTAPPVYHDGERLPLEQFNRLREENLRALKAIRRYVEDRREPYRPKGLYGWYSLRLFSLYGLPWAGHKHDK